VKLSDATLMLHHDGELDRDGERSVRVGALVDPRVGERLDVLAELGGLVRIWAARAGVDAAEERRRALRVRARRRALAACGSVALSLAAVPWLLPRVAERAASVRALPNAELSSTLPARAPEAVRVETVDFGARAGSIFSVPGGAASETTVVWLPDDAEGARGGS
jgi:hypothetical protein